LNFIQLRAGWTSDFQFHVDSLAHCVTNIIDMMMRWLQFFKLKGNDFYRNFSFALLSGILVGTSYIPLPPWALVFCYVPLWLTVTNNETSIKKAFWSGWVTQFTLTLIGFHWIIYTAHEFGELPWIVSFLALLLFCALMHLYIPAAVTLGVWLQKKYSFSRARTVFIIALLHALLERVWPAIFEWHLGYTFLWAKIPVYHFADIVGFQGLSTLVLLLNAWVAVIWLSQQQLKKTLIHLSLFVIICVSLILGGSSHGKDWNHFDGEVHATIIQANIGNMEKVAAEKGRGFQETITRKFTTMSQEALVKFPDTDIFVWPETAFPDYLDQRLLGRKHTNIFAETMGPLERPVLTGAFSKDEKTDAKLDQSTYNALFLVDPRGNSIDKPYRKTHLLAFGEYMPLSETFPIILKLLPFISNFGRGLGPDVISWNFRGDIIHWGGQICYEGLYPSFTRGLEEKGADILVNVTNDSWFGRPFEPQQHLYMTLARAIEVRRPLIRSTNTGISTAIWANGDVQQKSPLHQEWSGDFVLKYLKNAPKTFYVR
ncbi:MAG TPA: apolipoprotein N-acyltransferase, partial [Bdellovibrio sp.]|nr:apolipoprotein N-acyltransferase [Bdellovibrio sp.]